MGIFRDGEELQAAVNELKQLLIDCKDISIKNKILAGNPELDEAYRVPKMIKIALCAALGALERKESRGAHTRRDYPNRDDANYLNRTLTSWKNPDDLLPTIEYEALDIMKMELAPGFRGYGNKDNLIPHPQVDERLSQIEQITQDIKNNGGNRFELQNALMPYELSPKYKAKNERFGIEYE